MFATEGAKFPIVLAELPRNNGEVTRIEIADFKGHKGLSVQNWFRTEDGKLRPTQKGIWLPLDWLSDIRKALRDAEKIAVALGLVRAPAPPTGVRSNWGGRSAVSKNRKQLRGEDG